MNFYESARFQYAAARLMVKLVQFRQSGRFVKNITNNSNFDVQLVSQSDGSFNINIESPEQSTGDDPFMRASLADLVAYVSERVVEKIDENSLQDTTTGSADRPPGGDAPGDAPVAALDRLIATIRSGEASASDLPPQIGELIKRRVAETDREQRLALNQAEISRIDIARSQKLIAMSAPLISEMATALRRSANTLEITTATTGGSNSVLFLDRRMAQEIETAIVDDEITPILADITQFNKDNGWGKFKIENGAKVINFSIPYDILPSIRRKLIDSMNVDMVYLQVYYVRDRSAEIVRALIVGILPTPER
ncbi:hypothetical protein [Methylobacterium sp. C1]|uniref:hypothetical protein n=1 Tax=Methylobacterium sp. C1 TaxID=1479019 RepID=UPI001FDAA0B7|nr:hypothetical protein [Methylobacterium sp. C1]